MGSTDHLVRVVDLDSQVNVILRGHGNIINSVAVKNTLTGGLIASASRDKTIRIWDVKSEKCTHVLMNHTESVKSVAWAPDSSGVLASGSYDFDVILWNLNVPPDYVVGTLSKHHQGVGALAWGKDGLVTGSWDGRVFLWESVLDDVLRKEYQLDFWKPRGITAEQCVSI